MSDTAFDRFREVTRRMEEVQMARQRAKNHAIVEGYER